MLVNAPTKGLKMPRIVKREMQVSSVEQAKSFLKAALPTAYGVVFAVAVTTGMRPSEYFGLKWQDIDWERGTVSVRRTLRKRSRGCLGRPSVQVADALLGCRTGLSRFSNERRTGGTACCGSS